MNKGETEAGTVADRPGDEDGGESLPHGISDDFK